jgi:tetratricopeptide (TPR) repeat protein
VLFGQRTSDEMAELWFQVVPRREADRPKLAAAVQDKVLREEIVGHEKMLEADPSNVALHDGVALMHAHMGNLAGAAEHFAATVRANPNSPAAHYNLGMALLMLGRGGEAGASLEQALALNPDYARSGAAGARPRGRGACALRAGVDAQSRQRRGAPALRGTEEAMSPRPAAYQVLRSRMLPVETR